MGHPGVKFKFKKADISNAIEQSDGYAINAMEILDCGKQYFYEKLKEFPELKLLLEEKRDKRVSRLISKSETTLEWTLDNKEIMPSVAQRSAMYILDNQAKNLGYNKQTEANTSAPRDEILKQEQRIIELEYANMKLRNESKSETNPQL